LNLNLYWILVGLAVLGVMFSSIEMFIGIPICIAGLIALAYLWDKMLGGKK